MSYKYLYFKNNMVNFDEFVNLFKITGKPR